MKDEYDNKRVKGKIINILEKHKNNPFVYSKLKMFSELFMGYKCIDNIGSYRELAKLTSKIDYGCGFKDGNCCKEYEGSSRKPEMCCCASCWSSRGFFRMRFFNHRYSEEYIERELLYYARKFNIQTGFWREDKGCILPRERRSATCLTYNCRHGYLRREEELLLKMIREFHCLPSYTSSIIYMLKNYFLYKDVK